MEFGEVASKSAAGKVLAHSVKVAGGRIAKGTVLDDRLVALLLEEGIEKVTAATIEAGEVGEDEAARRVAGALLGDNLALGKATSGRANLFAKRAGLFRVDAAKVNELNAIDPAVTLATLPDRAHVDEGRLVATVKVIPFAVKESSVQGCEQAGSMVKVNAYLANKVELVQTRLPALKEKVLDKTMVVTKKRLAQCNSILVSEKRCAHEVGELGQAMEDAVAKKPDILLVSVASAVCDERDVLPAAIRKVGGEVRSVGMPVDPGNLLVLGRIGDTAVIGLPGCARSPKANGFDWVLRRLCAGECVTAQDISAMGAGGLLEEIHERRQHRVADDKPDKAPLAAVLLAAGMSSRMAGKNKLLETWRGKPLVRHAAEVLAQALADGLVDKVVAVTGKDRGKVESVLDGLGFSFVHNENYESGMASSLAAGVSALGEDVAGAFVCLGDMPSVSLELLGKLAGAFAPAEGKDIVVPACGPRRGHPVLFGARHFAELAGIEGDVGARSVLSRNESSVVEVGAGQEALLDLDDAEAFKAAG